MKFRLILFGAMLALSLCAVFSFKSKPRFSVNASCWLGNNQLCTTGTTNEAICTPTGTGPRCTMYIGLHIPSDLHDAFQYTTPQCTIPIYQVP